MMQLLLQLALGVCLAMLCKAATEEELPYYNYGRSFPFLPAAGSSRPFNSFFPRFVSPEEVEALAIRVNTLQEACTACCLPKCPNQAIEAGAKVVGSFCYSVETVAQNFPNARRVCFEQGGILAEPPFSDGNFYKNLKEKFEQELTDINTTPIIIGASSVEDPDDAGMILFQYLTSRVFIPSDHTIWETAPDPGPNFEINDDDAQEVATLIPPSGDSTQWRLGRDIVSLLTMRPFICQYPTY